MFADAGPGVFVPGITGSAIELAYVGLSMPWFALDATTPVVCSRGVAGRLVERDLLAVGRDRPG